MSIYTIVRRSYHCVVPEAARHALYTRSPRAVKHVKRFFVRLLERGAGHDEIYDALYYNSIVEPTMQLSVRAMVNSIVVDVAPKSVADLGCGSGLLLAGLRDRGVAVQGFEYSKAALDLCRARNIPAVQLDIENDPPPEGSYDVVISTEVAEHLPEACANRFVNMLCGLGPVVVLTAATPSDAGTDHVNEQPNEYWIERFKANGFEFDQVLSQAWRSSWRAEGVAHCFAGSVMVFRREGPRHVETK